MAACSRQVVAFALLATAAAAAPITCDTAVVGGGWAGVYAAWRLVVDTATVKPENVCLFEQRKAVGGRTYSVDVGELTVDIGAYRFGMHMHLPADIIVHALKLNTTCYEPSCKPDAEFNQTLYRIVDADGHNAGYATPLRIMTKALTDAGVRMYYEHELTGLYDEPVAVEARGEAPASMLHFAGGSVARAQAVLLNLPRAAVERLDPKSVLFVPDHTALPVQLLRNCSPCTGPGVPSTSIAIKVYAIYDDPWWLTKLKLAEGNFVSKPSDPGPPLVGRYHDGPVRHDASGKVVGPGALEAVYAFSFLHPDISW